MQHNWGVSKKTVLITGGTDGIGAATVRALARTGAEIILLARNVQKAERAYGSHKNVHIVECDLASLESVARAARDCEKRFPTIHALINIAGVMPLEREVSKDGIELNWAVNYVAPVLLTELLLPTLSRSAPARVINVTSSLYKVGTIDLADMRAEKVVDRYQAYGNSKMALMLYTRALGEELVGQGVTVNAVHPGWIRTKLATATLQKSSFLARTLLPLLRMRPAWYGARTIVWLASDPTLATTGEYFINKKIAASNTTSRDLSLAHNLTEATRALLAPYR